MNKLIEDPKHLEYVRKIAKRYYYSVPLDKRGLITVDDLFLAGYEGMMRAAGEYKPGYGTKFTTYSTKWIKYEIEKELRFYIGKDALLLDETAEQMLVSNDGDVEAQAVTGPDISDIPEEEQVRIIRSKLNEYKLTSDEITVYMAVNGIGCKKVTNLKVLAGQMKMLEMEIRSIEQSAEEKLRKSLS